MVFCADEGTRTLTSLGHKILSLARLPITTHPQKSRQSYSKKINAKGISSSEFEVSAEVDFSYLFVFCKLL